MCGLSGIMGDVTHKEETLFKQLLVFGSVRGMDSTGAASIGRNEYGSGGREIKLSKEVGPFPYLFDLKSFDKLFHGVNSCFIGHNRSKTTGDTTRKSAHPFIFEDIVGAHNGTIDYQNKNRLEQGHLFKTDSEAIFNNIQVHGIEDTISRLDKTEAYALTWYDKTDNSMNFLRNDHRPLIYAFINKGRTIVWASEYEYLMSAIYRNGFETEGKARVFSPDFHYKFFIPKGCNDLIKDAVTKKYENYTYKWLGKKNQDVKDQNQSTMRSILPGYTRTSSNTPFVPGAHSAIVYEKDIDPSPKNNFIGPLNNHYQDPKVIVESAKKNLAESEKRTTLILPHKPMGPEQVVRKRAYDRAQLAGLVPLPPSHGANPTPLVYSDDGIKVHRRLGDGLWITLRWNNTREEWGRFETTKAPDEMPYPLIDVNSNHCFKHTGRKKNKRIYYKGYNGKLLNQKEFENFMAQGCLNCERTPEWGNEVAFVSTGHAFLCPHCRLQPGLIETSKEAAQEAA